MALQQQQPELLRRLGSHEAGLALTSLLLMRYEGALIEPPQRLSVIPRGEVRLGEGGLAIRMEESDEDCMLAWLSLLMWNQALVP